MKSYTFEVYKTDRRAKAGERLVEKRDLEFGALDCAMDWAATEWPATKGFRVETYQTMVTRRNYMSGQEYVERYDIPRYCSPSSEAYWSM